MQLNCVSTGGAFRRAAIALGLAIAVLLGQHAAALHDLGHAFECMHEHPPGAPHGPDSCPHHAAFADLSSAAASVGFAAMRVDAATVLALPRALASTAATRFAFHSRAPPALRV
jgi:hypothetical protein